MEMLIGFVFIGAAVLLSSFGTAFLSSLVISNLAYLVLRNEDRALKVGQGAFWLTWMLVMSFIYLGFFKRV